MVVLGLPDRDGGASAVSVDRGLRSKRADEGIEEVLVEQGGGPRRQRCRLGGGRLSTSARLLAARRGLDGERRLEVIHPYERRGRELRAPAAQLGEADIGDEGREEEQDQRDGDEDERQPPPPGQFSERFGVAVSWVRS